jgi:hypothetical protein
MTGVLIEKQMLQLLLCILIQNRDHIFPILCDCTLTEDSPISAHDNHFSTLSL